MPDDDYTTIGGFVFGALGRLPVVGDRVTAGGAVFTVARWTAGASSHSPSTCTRRAIGGANRANGVADAYSFLPRGSSCGRFANCHAFTAMIVAACATSLGHDVVVVVDL